MRRYRSRSHFKPYSIRRSEKHTRNRLVFTVVLSAVLIYLLLFWIIPNLIGGLSLLNRFKGTPPAQNVVEDSKLAPPVLNIPYEATNTAQINIKGYAQSGTVVEIYLDDNLQTRVQTKEDGSFLAEGITLFLGTNSISGKTLDQEDHQSLSSKPIRIVYDNERPRLELESPADNLEVKGERKLQVKGSTTPGEEITVTISGSRTIVNDDGTFTLTINLSDGENLILVVATDKAGNSRELSAKVTFQP